MRTASTEEPVCTRSGSKRTNLDHTGYIGSILVHLIYIAMLPPAQKPDSPGC